MTTIQQHDFRVEETHHSAFSRWHQAIPHEKLLVPFETFEEVRGRKVDVTYDAEVVYISVHHHWDEKKQSWWSSGTAEGYLINPKTGERFKSGWKKHSLHQLTLSAIPEVKYFIDYIIAQTVPHTVITVTEVPA